MNRKNIVSSWVNDILDSKKRLKSELKLELVELPYAYFLGGLAKCRYPTVRLQGDQGLDT